MLHTAFTEVYPNLKNIEIRYDTQIINQDDNANSSSVYDKAKEYINKNYSDPQLSSNTVAEYVGLSRDYFLKQFKAQQGISMSDYLNTIRIKEACRIIKTESIPLAEIAEKVGYSNIKTFTRAFTKIVGITPGKY